MSEPRRIQLSRRKGYRLPPNTVNVDRTTKWGNPFAVGEHIDRDSPLWPYVAEFVPGGVDGFRSVAVTRAEDVVQLHFRWFIEQPHLMLTVQEELGGRNLACWCRPGAPCHADFLLGMANDTIEMPDYGGEEGSEQ